MSGYSCFNDKVIFQLVYEYQPTISYHKFDKKIKIFNGDLCDKDLLSRIISEEKINSIYHLAAQVEVGVGTLNPYLTFETNVRGTYSLLEACRLFPDKLDSIVIASSDKSYGSYHRRHCHIGNGSDIDW